MRFRRRPTLNNFSSNVISGIRAAETVQNQSLFENLKDRVPWLFNILHAFEGRPGLIGGAATSLCLLLVFGLVLSDQTDSTPGNMMSANAQPSRSSGLQHPAAAPTIPRLDVIRIAALPASPLSTNPVTSLQPVATLFGQPSSLVVSILPVFQPAGQ